MEPRVSASWTLRPCAGLAGLTRLAGLTGLAGLAGLVGLALLSLSWAGGGVARADTLGLPPCTPFGAEWKLDRAPPGAGPVLVVRTASDWRRLWGKLGRKAPPLDFESAMVVGVHAPPRGRLVIYRVQVDNPAAARRLEVRVAERAAFCDMKDGPQGARLHLAAVPRSALPVWFVRDQMIDGGMFGRQNEGTQQSELGQVPGAARPKASLPVVLREEAERLAFAALDAPEVSRIRLGPLGRPLGRVLHPWVPVLVQRLEATWRIRYHTIELWVDVATGRVSRPRR